MEKLELIKKNYWQITSVNVGIDRNGNVGSVYLLLANSKVHQYTKKLFFPIEQYVKFFGQPTEFSKFGISSACVGLWLEISEYLDILEEEPEQTKSLL